MTVQSSSTAVARSDRASEHELLVERPRFSVIVPCFNEEGAIVETIESIRRTGYPDGLCCCR